MGGNPGRYVWFTALYNARAYYPILAILFLDLGLTLDQYVMLNLVWAATIFLFEVPSGALADTLGRKNLLVTASLLMVAEMSCLLFAPKDGGWLLFSLCVANRLLSGLSEAAASGAAAALGGGDAEVEHRHFEIFDDGELLDEVELLEDEADALRADFGELVVGEVGDVLAAEDVVAGGGLVEAAEDVHEGGFARAGGTHDGGELVGFEVEGGFAEGVDFDVGTGLAVDFGDAIDFGDDV